MGVGSRQSSKPKAEVETICRRENGKPYKRRFRVQESLMGWEKLEGRAHSPCAESVEHVGEEGES